jgi:hypothetical protein
MGNYHWRFDYKKSQDLELEPIAKSIVKKPLQKGAKMGVALTLRWYKSLERILIFFTESENVPFSEVSKSALTTTHPKHPTYPPHSFHFASPRL